MNEGGTTIWLSSDMAGIVAAERRRRILGVNPGQQGLQPPSLGLAHRELRNVGAEPLFSAGGLQQAAVYVGGPCPAQFVALESQVERQTMPFFGIGQCSVQVKYQGIDAHLRLLDKESVGDLGSLPPRRPL